MLDGRGRRCRERLASKSREGRERRGGQDGRKGRGAGWAADGSVSVSVRGRGNKRAHSGQWRRRGGRRTWTWRATSDDGMRWRSGGKVKGGGRPRLFRRKELGALRAHRERMLRVDGKIGSRARPPCFRIGGASARHHRRGSRRRLRDADSAFLA